MRKSTIWSEAPTSWSVCLISTRPSDSTSSTGGAAGVGEKWCSSGEAVSAVVVLASVVLSLRLWCPLLPASEELVAEK